MTDHSANPAACVGRCIEPDNCSSCKVGLFAPVVEPQQPTVAAFTAKHVGRLPLPQQPTYDYAVCDGLCAPDECVCPSVAQRTAEVKAAVDAERARIRGIIEATRDSWASAEGGLAVAIVNTLNAHLAAIDGGDE